MSLATACFRNIVSARRGGRQVVRAVSPPTAEKDTGRWRGEHLGVVVEVWRVRRKQEVSGLESAAVDGVEFPMAAQSQGGPPPERAARTRCYIWRTHDVARREPRPC